MITQYPYSPSVSEAAGREVSNSEASHFVVSLPYQQIVTAQLYYNNITEILNKYFLTKVIEPGVRSNAKLGCSILYELSSQIINYIMAKPYSIVQGRPDSTHIIPIEQLNKIAVDLICSGYAVMGVRSGKVLRVPPEAVDVRTGEWLGWDYMTWRQRFLAYDTYEQTIAQPTEDFFPKPDHFVIARLNFPSLIARTKTLIDAYEVLYSRKHDSLTDAPNAPLIIKGYLDNPDEIINRAREDGAICVAKDGEVSCLKCDVDYSEQDAQLDRLLASIYRAAECVPPLHNSGADTSSVTLKMMYTALDSAARRLGNQILEALYALLSVPNLNVPGFSHTELQEIRIAFNFAAMITENDDITNAVQLTGILSRQALLEHIPWIKNVEDELARPTLEESREAAAAKPTSKIDDPHQANNRYDIRKSVASRA